MHIHLYIYFECIPEVLDLNHAYAKTAFPEPEKKIK